MLSSGSLLDAQVFSWYNIGLHEGFFIWKIHVSVPEQTCKQTFFLIYHSE